MTAHPEARKLCELLGHAVTSTSANRAGEEPLTEVDEVYARFGSTIDCVLAGVTGGLKAPTEIRDAATGDVLRPGI